MIEVKLTFIDCDVRKLIESLEESIKEDRGLKMRLTSMEIESDSIRIVNEYKQGIGD